MKELMILSVLAVFAASPAFAEEAVKADTQVKKERQHKGGEHFKKRDTNGDGVISQSEFMAHAKERFKKIDTDGSGDISKEEAMAHMKEKHGKMKEHRAKKGGE